MSVGFVMLVHEALDRAAEVARYWAENGCPVVIHVDRRVANGAHDAMVSGLSDLENVRFCARHRCEWGKWSLVQASQTAAAMMLDSVKDVRHVFLASGSCLPLRPVGDLVKYLDDRPMTNFIESVTTEEVPWTMGGLNYERFTLRFPFSWKRQRRLFDGYVRLQRRLGVKRRIPGGLVPHLGSQWWCLTRQTLSAILQDPDRDIYDRYFARVWIPDESYYQTLVRQFSDNIESRSLTLSKFDDQGKPYVFHDDHLELLRRSDCFVARKISPHAGRLYDGFLKEAGDIMRGAEPNPGKIDRIFAKAAERRTKGRAGLYMQSRFPRKGREQGVTSAPYAVFEGFDALFEDFEPWLHRVTGARVHGHLFAPEKVEFANREPEFSGALSDSALIRDRNPEAFLTSLIWNARGERQCFQFGPADNQAVSWMIARDPNAQVSVISGAWAVSLFRRNWDFAKLRSEAAKLQKIETAHLEILRSIHTRANVQIWSLAEFVESPTEPLQSIIASLGLPDRHRLTEAPKMTSLEGFGKFVQTLKNQGMHPHLVGDLASVTGRQDRAERPQKPYVVK